MTAARAVLGKALAGCAFAVQLGCVAVREYDSIPASQRVDLPSAHLVDVPIAVRVQPSYFLHDTPERTVEFAAARRRAAAQRLVAVLRESQLFPAVGSVDELEGQRAIVVEPIDAPASEGDADMVWAWGYTLGLIPMVETHDWGIYLRRVDGDVPELRCEWKVTSVMGWAALALLPFDAWQQRYDPAAFDYALRRCLIEQREVFREEPG
jgi:hypothetical protein